MKILIITPDIYPIEKGYGARNSKNIGDALINLGHNVNIVSSCPAYKIKKSQLVDKNIEIIEICKLSAKSRKLEYILPLKRKDRNRLRTILSDSDTYDFVLINDFLWSISFSSLMILRKSNYKRILVINHGFFRPAENKVLRLLLKTIYKYFIQIFSNGVIGVLSYSRQSYNEFNALNTRLKSYLRPLCIETSHFKMIFYNAVTKESSKDLMLSEKEFIFTISAHYPYKGFDVLLRSYRRLLADFPNVNLVIGGQPTWYTEILSLLSKDLSLDDRVNFVGPIDDETKLNLILRSRVFVIPSLREGFGAGAMEADVLQVKVVATDTGAHRDILTNNRFARIVAPGNEYNLYEGMKSLLSMVEEPPRTLDIDKLNFYSCESLASFIISIAK